MSGQQLLRMQVGFNTVTKLIKAFVVLTDLLGAIKGKNLEDLFYVVYLLAWHLLIL